MTKRTTRAAVGAAALTLSVVGMLGAIPASAHDSDSRSKDRHHHRSVVVRADLDELNNSGASGKATVIVKDGRIKHVQVRARGLSPDAPHAQHVHFGQDALNECPTLALDTNRDGRLNTVEGIPAYGPVAVSLTTSGDTGPGSVLAVDRFPVSDDGRYFYKRTDVAFSDVMGAGAGGGTATAAQVAAGVAAGKGVVVIHGIDYDGNGTYSLSEEGASELDPSLPAEATDPAACGVLR